MGKGFEVFVAGFGFAVFQIILLTMTRFVAVDFEEVIVCILFLIVGASIGINIDNQGG